MEIMDESNKVVSLDYLKCSRHMEKLTVELGRVKATNEKLMKQGKTKESELTHLQSVILQEKTTRDKLQKALKESEGLLHVEQNAKQVTFQEILDKTRELSCIQSTSFDMAQVQAQLQEATAEKEKEHQELVSTQSLMAEEREVKDKLLQYFQTWQTQSA